MKIVNLCIGKRPPVVRMYAGQSRTICYQLVENMIDCQQPNSSTTPSQYIPNMARPNTFPGGEYINYRLYSDTMDHSGSVPVLGNKFRITIPPLGVGYYYLDVKGYGTQNSIIINVL